MAQQDYRFDETTSKDDSVVLFTSEQRKDYTYASQDPNMSAVEYMIAHPDELSEMINHFITVQVPRLKVLESYTDGNNYGILNRKERKDEGKSDRRSRHDYGGYISNFHTGYDFGNPVKIELKGEDSLANTAQKDWIDRFNHLNDVDELNQSLGWDCNTFGRAFEIAWREEPETDDINQEPDAAEIEDRVAKSSVFDTFMIRDTSVKKQVIAAVRCPRYTIGDTENIETTVYTKTTIYHFGVTESSNIELNFSDAQAIENLYGEIPIIEWRNNDRRIGTFEKQLSQIDDYDANQSDTSNYMSDFLDAILAIFGNIDMSIIDEEWVERVRESNIGIFKSLPDVDGKPTSLEARYMYKEYDVDGKEANSRRIENDIHKFSHTPDLTDDKFAGNSSGIAMAYRLMGVDQIHDKKLSIFAKAIRDRYRLIGRIHKAVKDVEINANNLNIVFTPNIPRDNLGDLKAAIEAGAEISNETILTHVPCIENAQDEMERVETEQQSRVSQTEDLSPYEGLAYGKPEAFTAD